jgi:hypothetical protein
MVPGVLEEREREIGVETQPYVFSLLLVGACEAQRGSGWWNATNFR